MTLAIIIAAYIVIGVVVGFWIWKTGTDPFDTFLTVTLSLLCWPVVVLGVVAHAIGKALGAK